MGAGFAAGATLTFVLPLCLPSEVDGAVPRAVGSGAAAWIAPRTLAFSLRSIAPRTLAFSLRSIAPRTLAFSLRSIAPRTLAFSLRSMLRARDGAKDRAVHLEGSISPVFLRALRASVANLP